LRIIVVEDREVTPKKYCPFVSSPSIVPLKPHQYHRDNLGIAVIDAVPPTFIFLKLNSSPRLVKYNPNFCPDFNTLNVFTDGKKSKWVPARKPAIKYPRTKGCFIF
jgi:hypothetical protein